MEIHFGEWEWKSTITVTRTRWNRRRDAEDLQSSYKALSYELKQIGCPESGALSSTGDA